MDSPLLPLNIPLDTFTASENFLTLKSNTYPCPLAHVWDFHLAGPIDTIFGLDTVFQVMGCLQGPLFPPPPQAVSSRSSPNLGLFLDSEILF
jgi:hypothetical protein